MKEFALSKPHERITSVLVSLAVTAAMAVLVYFLRDNTMLFVLCAVCGVALSALLIVSTIGVLKAKCIVNLDTKTLEVKGLPSYTKDISSAVLLQTMARKSGHAISRMLVFSDAEETVIAMIPTMFTTRQGLMAEPMAKEMAQYLDIDFQANVPEWEYDKEKYEEHLKEEAEKEKAARKERAELRKKKLLYRYRDKK